MATKEQDLAALEALTSHIVGTLSDNIKKDSDTIVEYETVEGRITGYGLLNEENVAIQKIFSSKGSKLEYHIHKVKEWLIVIEGKYSIVIDKGQGAESIVLHHGESVYMEPGTCHSAEALEDTWIIAITVPADGGFPNARPLHQ